MSEYKITLNGTEYYLQVEKIGGDGDEKKRSLMSPGPGLPPPPKAPSPRRTPAPTAKAPASKPPETPRAQVPQSAAPVPEVFSGTNGGREEITAPIPGKILDILVQEGQTVKKGDVLLFNPGTVHQCTYSSPSAPLVEFYVSFTDIQLRGMERNQIRFPGRELLLHPGEKTFVLLSRLCTLIQAESQGRQPGRYFMLKAYVTQMILLLYREQVEDQKPKALGYIFESANKKYVVEQIVDYLDRHYNEKISLDQIAQNMYLSPFYISRIFKNEVGDTPINYLINLRMEKARKLLLEKQDCSIQEIAQCVGYDDAYHFSKLFKKHYGNSPSQYRARKSSKTQNPE